MAVVTLSIDSLEIPARPPCLPARTGRRERLRRRGLVARATLAMFATAVAALLVGRAGTVFGGGPASVPEHRLGSATYVVQDGDTLWNIAASLSNGGDIALLAQQLSNMNGGGALHVGQRLVLP